LGTEEGLYFSVDRGVNWRKWKHDVPAVPVRDMVIQAREGDLVLGTFGRAAYILEDLAPLRALATEGPGFLRSTFRAFDAADGYVVPNPRPAGSRFMADHVWEGANRERSAHGHLFVHPDTAKIHEEINIAIVSSTGDTLRRMTQEVDGGWQSFSWRGDMDGVRWPSRDLQSDKDPEGGGPLVLPGTYLAVLELGSHKDSMSLTIHADPRVPYDQESWTQAQTHTRAVQQEVSRLADLMQEVAQAEEALGTMQALWSLMPDSLTGTVDSLAKEANKEISAIHDMLWTPKDFVGYDHVTVRVMDKLYGAMSSRSEAPTPNDLRKFRIAQDAIDEVETRVDSFMGGLWSSLLSASADMRRGLNEVWEDIRQDADQE